MCRVQNDMTERRVTVKLLQGFILLYHLCVYFLSVVWDHLSWRAADWLILYFYPDLFCSDFSDVVSNLWCLETARLQDKWIQTLCEGRHCYLICWIVAHAHTHTHTPLPVCTCGMSITGCHAVKLMPTGCLHMMGCVRPPKKTAGGPTGMRVYSTVRLYSYVCGGVIEKDVSSEKKRNQCIVRKAILRGSGSKQIKNENVFVASTEKRESFHCCVLCLS